MPSPFEPFPSPDPMGTQQQAPPPEPAPAATQESVLKTIAIAAAPTILAGVVIYYLTRPSGA